MSFETPTNLESELESILEKLTPEQKAKMSIDTLTN